MVANAHLSAHHAVIADAATAGNAGLGGDHDVCADAAIVANVDQIVELRAGPDDGLIESAAVDGAVGANLDVVADDEAADLRELYVASELFVAHKAEAVGAEHRAGVHDHAAADGGSGIDHHARIDFAVVADDDAFADVASRRR